MVSLETLWEKTALKLINIKSLDYVLLSSFSLQSFFSGGHVTL